LSKYFNLKKRFVLATNSATSALHLGLKVMGIKPGDEVITPSFNCIADAQAIGWVGAKVVLCDIKEKDLGIDCEKAKKLITKKTKAIIPLHYAGIPCEQKEVYELAKKHNLRIMEDCCHAIGTKIKGKKIGSYGDIAVFSFDPVKTITSIDGGCIIVNDKKEKKIAENLRLLGMNKDTIERYKNKRAWIYDVVSEGYRYHMTNILASIGISQLNRLDEFITSRQKICKFYNESFREIPDLVTPKSDFNDISPFIYTPRILNQRREKFIDHMNKLKIDIGIHWNPIHRFSYFSKSKKDELSTTNKIADEICTIPLHSNMRSEHVNRVINGVKSFFKS
jgi:dTDP-4-amino-4,6-dideoxygalactose transaminase